MSSDSGYVAFECSHHPGAVVPDSVGFLSPNLTATGCRIEDHDRQILEDIALQGTEVAFHLRSFLPQEAAIWAAMGRPFQPCHDFMLCVLAADGGIDRRPISADAASLLTARGRLSPRIRNPKGFG